MMTLMRRMGIEDEIAIVIAIQGVRLNELVSENMIENGTVKRVSTG